MDGLKLKIEDLQMGMHVRGIDLQYIVDTYVYLGNYKTNIECLGEGDIVGFGKNAVKPKGNNICTYYKSYEEYLEECEGLDDDE